MRASLRIMIRVGVILMVAAGPVAADPGVSRADGGLHEEEKCAPAGPTRFRLLDWWREWFVSHWQRRDVRDDELDRATVTPFYLRSPLLSGFVGRGDSAPCAGGGSGMRAPEATDECVQLNLAPGAGRPRHIELPMPQLDVTNAVRLGAVINEKLDRGETAVVTLRSGQKYPIGPPLTDRVEARTCRKETAD